ncbi:MAG: FdhF/YdeP family oxidoreductase [Spongiibacteraceae bacterium]
MDTSKIVGGGAKKVLYTLSTVSRMGLLNSAKALKSNNACKACGLGMGGQRGGMTNEMDEFPSVCNKSIQAQSTDIQPAIPDEIFDHSLTDFKALSGREMETLGRLNSPIFKAADSDRFKPVSWDWALDFAAQRFKEGDPQQSFFYSSGRSSNEAGFILQLLARLYGTNNVNNCSFYCHQATGEGLKNTIGSGTATVELEDLSGCDLVFIIGANPASNHPRLVHQLKHCRDRGGKVVVINPAKEPGLVKFAVPKSVSSMLSGGSEIASDYLQPNIGSDVAVMAGIAKALLEQQRVDQPFIKAFTLGFDSYQTVIMQKSWGELCNQTGLLQADFERVATTYAESKNAVFCWGMGVTHHLHGVENVEAISNLALLRGMIGKRYAGLLPLRGHSNVQGIGTIGVKPVLAEDVFAALSSKLNVSLPTTEGLDTLACLQQAARGEMQNALIMGGNLLEASPDTQWTEEVFNKIGFKLYLTTTLNRGHVRGMDKGAALILPVTARDEEWQSTTQESMFNYVRLSDGGIQRLLQPRPEVNILCDLALKILEQSAVDFAAFKSHAKIRQAIAAIIPGMEQLADIDVAKKEFHVSGRLLHSPRFFTESKKANFITHALGDASRANSEYPFTLMSVRSEGQFNSIVYEEADSYRGNSHRWVVMMNQSDMQDLQLGEHDEVSIVSATGTLLGVKVTSFDVPKGNVMMYYPEANAVIGRDVDPRSQTPAFKSAPVRIVATA